MTKIITCYSCSGKGKIEIYTQKYYPGTRSTPAFEGSPGYSVNDKPTGQFKTCETCSGTGKLKEIITTKKCYECKGSGRQTNMRYISIDGKCFTCKGKGTLDERVTEKI